MRVSYLSHINSEKVIPLLLLMLAAYDLRGEIRLLIDHLTLTSLIYSIKSHPLSFSIIFLFPSLWKSYKV